MGFEVSGLWFGVEGFRFVIWGLIENSGFRSAGFEVFRILRLGNGMGATPCGHVHARQSVQCPEDILAVLLMLLLLLLPVCCRDSGTHCSRHSGCITRFALLPRQKRPETRFTSQKLRQFAEQGIVSLHVRQLQQRRVVPKAALSQRLQQCDARTHGFDPTTVAGNLDHGSYNANLYGKWYLEARISIKARAMTHTACSMTERVSVA